MNNSRLFYAVTRSASETYTNFEDHFHPYVFGICELIYCHLNAKPSLFTFLWLEFRFESVLKLHVHFKGFICIRMRKLH